MAIHIDSETSLLPSGHLMPREDDLFNIDAALTAHLQIPAGHPGDAFLCDTAEELEHQFGIGHTTLQIETDGSDCAQAPADAV